MEYKIINTENYLLVVDEDVTQAKENAWIVRSNIEPVLCDAHFLFDFKEPYRKVISHLPLNNSPILEGVDLLPTFDNDVEGWAEKYYGPGDYGLESKQGFIRGYNKAKKNYKYTEDDIMKAVEFGFRQNGNNGNIDCKEENDFIQSLNQPKLPIAFDLITTKYRVKSGTIQERKDGVAGYEYYKWVGTYKY